MKIYRHQIEVLLILFFSVILTSHAADLVEIPADKEKFHVFLLMGQSNMEGGSARFGINDTETHPRILKMGNVGWELAKDPISNNGYVNAVGPGLAFAKKLVEEDPEITVGLIPLAVGGTPISKWMKGSEFYNNAVYQALSARRYGVVKGVLWHQGEEDAEKHYTALPYGDNLEQLIDDFRRSIHDAYLPWIVGGYTDSKFTKEKSGSGIYGVKVWNLTKWVGTTFFRTGYVKSKGADFVDIDQIHFSSEGMRTMGERYCDIYLNTIGHWTQKAKETLDAEAIVHESGDDWKYHPTIGVYYDKEYPLIKHAQLGWLTVEYVKEYIEEDSGEIIPRTLLLFDSPFLGKDPDRYGRDIRTKGKFLVQNDENFPEAIYLYEVDFSDPETLTFQTPYYVNVLANLGDEGVFYDHATEKYLDTLPHLPLLKTAEDHNVVAERLFEKTQESAQLLINEIAEVGHAKKWSDMRRLVDDVQLYRDYTNFLSWEAFHHAREHETGVLRTFWMNRFLDLLLRIDPYVEAAQKNYQNETDIMLSSGG